MRYELGTLVDKPFASAKQYRPTLSLGTFGLDETHFGLPGRDHDGLRTGRIVDVSLYERLHVAKAQSASPDDQVIIYQAQ